MQVTGTTAYSYLPPQRQIQDQMFSKLDTDGDGSVSLSELEDTAAKAAGGTASAADTSKLEALFQSADTDGDGKLTESELDAQFRSLAPDTMSHMVQMQGQAPPSPDEVFAKADSDGSGSLSLDEFKAMGKAHGGHHHHHSSDSTSANAEGTASGDDDKLAQLFSKVDADGNGQVSQDELKAFFAQNHPPSPGANDQAAGEPGSAGRPADSTDTVSSANAIMQQIKAYLVQALSQSAQDSTSKTTVSIAA